MATRKGVAASIAAAILFSSLVVSDFVIFSGAAANFRLVSLATEERGYHVEAVLITSISVLDLLDGAQELLSSTRFSCSGVTDSLGRLIGSEVVRLDWGAISAYSTLSLAPDQSTFDNLSVLHPFNGSLPGGVNLEAVVLAFGRAPDGSVQYRRSEAHLVNLPVMLVSLTRHCLDAASQLSSALSTLGAQLCNSTAVFEAGSPVVSEAASSAATDGFDLSVGFSVAPGPKCGVNYTVVAEQAGVTGPEGRFTLVESESGYVGG